SSIPSYNLVPGQTSPPTILGYEGTPLDLVPTSVSNTDWLIRPAIAYDLFYHPYMVDMVQAYYYGLQQAGLSELQSNGLCGGFEEGLNSSTEQGNQDNQGQGQILYTAWQGQTWGAGDGTPDGNGNDTVNLTFNATGLSQDLNNVSPKLLGFRNWASVANTPPATTIALVGSITVSIGGTLHQIVVDV